MKYGSFIFKTASEPWEFEQIHSLNYRTIIEENPWYPTNQDQRLIDQFHNENIYYICLQQDRLVGMLALKRNRPFSLDETVENLDSYLPPGNCVCEMRLLAIEAEYRHTSIFSELLRFAAEECLLREISLVVLSGSLLQQKNLYANIEFIPFTKSPGNQGASGQPMYFYPQSALRIGKRHDLSNPKVTDPVSFLPVPVEINAKVRRAFNGRPISHRSNEFRLLLDETKALLLNLTGATHAELLLGSGTLANDVVAAQLRLLDGEGLVLANGMFGDRLINHAIRHCLRFQTFSLPWVEDFDFSALKEKLSSNTTGWLWATHCETFWGNLNNLEKLKEICREYNVKLCLDCISSVGVVPVSLNDVFLATTVSGKGLASYPGIAVVLYNHEAFPDNRLPIYLDLGYYRSKGGAPFTHSHNLVAALREALLIITTKPKYEMIRRESAWLRRGLERFGIRIVSGAAEVSPAILTIVLPRPVSSVRVGEDLEERGFLLSYGSDYLVKNNLLRICLLGETTHSQHRQLLNTIIRIYSRYTATERINNLSSPQ